MSLMSGYEISVMVNKSQEWLNNLINFRDIKIHKNVISGDFVLTLKYVNDNISRFFKIFISMVDF